MSSPRSSIEVHAFGPLWAAPLPSSAPFPLKLITWLRMTGLAHTIREQNDPRRGPKGKSPWVVLDGEVVGDTELIIARLERSHGVDLDAKITGRDRAIGTAFRRMLEDHYHQVYEHALFFDAGGDERLARLVAQAPALVRPFALRGVREQIREQLRQRGVGRHTPREIVDMGRRDLDAIASVLESSPFVLGEVPTTVDATAFAFVAVSLHPPIESPLFQYARSLEPLRRYYAAGVRRWFPEAISTLPHGA